MKLLALVLLFQIVAPDPHHFRYERQILIPPGQSGQACTILTPDLFAHASGSLTDLRLYAGETPAADSELPYALTMSESATLTSETAKVLNLGSSGNRIVFDLEMPARSYTDVDLDLTASNFIATAQVFGLSGQDQGMGTRLGEFTLFDLTSQHLARSTRLALQESTFPRLHVELTLTPAPGTPPQTFAPSVVAEASVPPSREAQTLYTPVAETTTFRHADRNTIAEIPIPAHVPVERIEFLLPPSFKSNFSRLVKITAHAPKEAAPEQLAGAISRVDLPSTSHPIHERLLTIPATLGANLQSDATVQVAVEDGDDRPLPFAAVRLEMRQRQLCFEPPVTSPTLFYGDSVLHAPVYDYARVFRPSTSVRGAQLGPEHLNPAFAPRADSRPLTERHPELLWIVLLIVIGLLGLIAFRNARYIPR